MKAEALKEDIFAVLGVFLPLIAGILGILVYAHSTFVTTREVNTIQSGLSRLEDKVDRLLERSKK